MPPKHKRLSRAAFSQYFTTGSKSHNKCFTFVYTPTSETQFAVVVGKKVYKQAVARNRLRRRLYHLLQATVTAQGLSGVCILITKPAVRQCTDTEVVAHLETLVGRVAKNQ